MKIALVAVALLVLNGCTAQLPATPTSQQPEVPVSSAPPEVAASPTPSLTPSASPAVVTTAGYGSLKLGKPVPQDSTLTWVPDWCTKLMGKSIYGGSAWVVNPGGDYFDQPYYVSLDGDSRTDRVDRIAIVSPDITTKSGAHTGMLVSDLVKLFPDAEIIDGGQGLALYVVSDNLGQVVFDTGPDDIFADNPNAPYVQYIHVLSVGAEPYSAQYADGGLGECSS